MSEKIVARVADAVARLEEMHRLGVRLADGPTIAFAASKRLLELSVENSLERQLEAEAEAFARLARLARRARTCARVCAPSSRNKPEFKGR